nr:MAG TPA: hypothetical protein [Caudoviricetes sp.]
MTDLSHIFPRPRGGQNLYGYPLGQRAWVLRTKIPVQTGY